MRMSQDSLSLQLLLTEGVEEFQGVRSPEDFKFLIQDEDGSVEPVIVNISKLGYKTEKQIYIMVNSEILDICLKRFKHENYSEIVFQTLKKKMDEGFKDIQKTFYSKTGMPEFEFDCIMYMCYCHVFFNKPLPVVKDCKLDILFEDQESES